MIGGRVNPNYRNDQAEYKRQQDVADAPAIGVQNVKSAAAGNAKYSTSYTDPNSGQSYSYSPGGGGGNGSGSGGGQYDIWSDYKKASSRVPRMIAPRVRGASAADRQGAEDAQFSRAKDRIGQATQGLLKSVNSSFGARGLAGSSMEGRAMSGAMEAGLGQASDVLRTQAVEGLRRDDEVSDRNYAGDITQRGQDMASQQQREQMIQALTRMARQSGGVY
jgi:hypothetical protein